MGKQEPVDVEQLITEMWEVGDYYESGCEPIEAKIRQLAAERDGYKVNSEYHKTLYLGAKDLHEKAESELKGLKEVCEDLGGQVRLTRRLKRRGING